MLKRVEAGYNLSSASKNEGFILEYKGFSQSPFKKHAQLLDYAA